MQFKTLYAALAAVALVHAQEDPPSLTDALTSNDNLTALNELLANYPDLVEMLGEAENITIFAPSNEAIAELMDAPNFAEMAEDAGLITAILQYHVVDGSVPSENITSTPVFLQTMLTNDDYTDVTDGQVLGARLVDDAPVVISGSGLMANITQTDIVIANGIVHIIDAVLTVPPPVSSLALAAGFTSLVGALAVTELTDAVDNTPDVTIFAPVNEAFTDIGSVLANLSSEDAADILQYHVIEGMVAYSNMIADGTNATTLSGSQVNFTVSDDGEVFVNSARVIAADILVANGVVHVIDAVLNPNSTLEVDPEVDEPRPAFEGATEGDSPFTSTVTEAASTVTLMTTDAVADGYTVVPTGDVAEETSEGAAPMITGAVGAAALFGGAALLAQF